MKKDLTTEVLPGGFKEQERYMELVRGLNQGRGRKYFISTFGCQMNENDSEKLAGMLKKMGYEEGRDEAVSDVIVYNTCCVRESAEQKIYGHLGALKKLKEEKPDLVIAFCGCMAQKADVVEHIKNSYGHVDLVFGTFNIHRFPELLYEAINTRKTLVDVWDSWDQVVEGVPIERKDGVKAWVTVIYGCNNFCSYCIVPYVRGRERSRKPEDILEEVRALGRSGCKEVTLLGQNVNSYGKDLGNGLNFAGLLKMVNGVEEIERIRFMTSHPKDLTADLVSAIRDLNKVCEHLHLPIQAGSSRILRKMNRRYSKEQYLDMVDMIKREVPGIAITTDIIVGFPGESDEDFEESLDVVRKARFDMAYTFLYSKRQGTPAARDPDQVPEDVKKERFNRLLEEQNRISLEINKALEGQRLEVLVEGPSKNNEAVLTGRTRTNKIVNFSGSRDLTGRLVRVKITGARTWYLEGEMEE